jgi:hypothetical protein
MTGKHIESKVSVTMHEKPLDIWFDGGCRVRFKIKLHSLAPQVGHELEHGLNNSLTADKIDQEPGTGIVGLQYTVRSLLAFAYVLCEFALAGSFDEDLIKFTSAVSGKKVDVILTSKDVWISCTSRSSITRAREMVNMPQR